MFFVKLFVGTGLAPARKGICKADVGRTRLFSEPSKSRDSACAGAHTPFPQDSGKGAFFALFLNAGDFRQFVETDL